MLWKESTTVANLRSKKFIWIEAELDVLYDWIVILERKSQYCRVAIISCFSLWWQIGRACALNELIVLVSRSRFVVLFVICWNGTCNKLADTSLGFLVAGGGAGARSRSRGNLGSGDDGGRGNGGGGAPWASHFLECNKVPNMRRPRPDADVAALLKSLANKQGRKYSLDSVKMSLEAILQQGVSTTQASEMYGINRSTLQFYLKKLNVVRRRWKHQPSSPIFTPVQPRRT